MIIKYWRKWLYARSSQLGREVADLLVNESHSWSSNDGYYLRDEKRRVDIWIANQAYALKLLVWPMKPGFPREIYPPWADRMLIWSLVKPLNVPVPEEFVANAAVNAIRSHGNTKAS
jgi:hypothetical protein